MSSISTLDGNKGKDKYYNDDRCRNFYSISLNSLRGTARYATIFGLNQVQYQQLCYGLEHGIPATEGTRLEVVTDMSLQ